MRRLGQTRGQIRLSCRNPNIAREQWDLNLRPERQQKDLPLRLRQQWPNLSLRPQ
jgi:hypothetical protein